MSPVLIDTDILSEILKQHDANVLHNAHVYLNVWRRFTFSVLTRYEILRGLRAKSWRSTPCAIQAKFCL